MIVPILFFATGTIGLLYSLHQMDSPSHRECKGLRCRWYLAANGFNLVGFSSGSWLLLAYGATAGALH